MKSVYVCEVLRAVSSIRYADVYACVYFICYIYIYIYIYYVYICMLYTWNSPGQNTGVGGRSLLLGIFPTQGSNPDVPHCRWILYQLSCQGSPRTLQWVAYPFSSRSSQPRNRPGSPALQLDSLPAELPGKPVMYMCIYTHIYYVCICMIDESQIRKVNLRRGYWIYLFFLKKIRNILSLSL